jgi:hypothetical protein
VNASNSLSADHGDCELSATSLSSFSCFKQPEKGKLPLSMNSLNFGTFSDLETDKNAKMITTALIIDCFLELPILKTFE